MAFDLPSHFEMDLCSVLESGRQELIVLSREGNMRKCWRVDAQIQIPKQIFNLMIITFDVE
jgi:hypothetical protein